MEGWCHAARWLTSAARSRSSPASQWPRACTFQSGEGQPSLEGGDGRRQIGVDLKVLLKAHLVQHLVHLGLGV